MREIEYKGFVYPDITKVPIPKIKGHHAANADNPLPPVFRVQRDSKSYVIYRENTLIPCAETVQLAKRFSHVVRKMTESDKFLFPLSVVCIGVGSGVDILTLSESLHDKVASQNPSIRLIGTDISGSALTSTELNAAINGLNGFALRKRDLFDGLVTEFGKLDAVFFNPPFLPTHANAIISLSKHKGAAPQEAIDGGNDGLDYFRRVFQDARDVLSNRGFIMTQHMSSQTERIHSIASQSLPGASVVSLARTSGNPCATVVGNPETIALFSRN